MMVSFTDVLWGAIGLATLTLVMALVAMVWEMRSVLRIVAVSTSQLTGGVQPVLEDMEHIVQRLETISAVVEEKIEATNNLVDHVVHGVGASVAGGKALAQVSWASTRQWFGRLGIGIRAGMRVLRQGTPRPTTSLAVIPVMTTVVMVIPKTDAPDAHVMVAVDRVNSPVSAVPIIIPALR
ncbi:MAG: hypothetical protein H7338_20985 [Candidatus Sericytochromatia bacterium]|nr:hypothetical protein [Candidatus Sericytochromatia bacterium]